MSGMHIKNPITVKYHEIVVSGDKYKSTLFEFDSSGDPSKSQKFWVPKSISVLDENSKEITMPKWLYDKNFLADA